VLINENNSMMIPEEVIMSKIYLIRGLEVMMDKYLSDSINCDKSITIYCNFTI
jgi:hypothetical protein